MRLIARCKEDIGISAIDFFSFIHTFVGFVVFLIINAVLLALYKIPLLNFSLIYTCSSALIWESLENSIFHHYGIKFAQHRDSFINSLMDIVFFSLGGLTALVLIQIGGILFIINTIIFLHLIILLASLYLAKILDIKKIIKNSFKARIKN